MFDVSHPEIREAVRRALEEDIGTGDLTTVLCVPPGRSAAGRFIAREPMVVAGVELLAPIYHQLGGVADLEIEKPSGASAIAGDSVARVRGPARTLLSAERVALNFLQRLSGIATLGRRFVDAARGTRCRILDTRKTTPGLRRLEKMAAAAGGVVNHRMGLFDAVLIKNNHIAAAGGVARAIERARAAEPVEIEVRTLDELEEALRAGAARLLLDNLSPTQARQWILAAGGRAVIELSGGITLENVRDYAETGADFLSCGAITHSAPAADLNFRLELEPDATGS